MINLVYFANFNLDAFRSETHLWQMHFLISSFLSSTSNAIASECLFSATYYFYFPFVLRASYPGTLFRFPLRTASMARQSEISKRSYSTSDVKATLLQLSQQLPSLLLFLRNVKHISIYQYQGGEGAGRDTSPIPKLLSSAVAKVRDRELANDQSLLAYLYRSSRSDGSSNDSGKSNSKVTNGKTSAEVSGSKDSFYAQLAVTPDNKLPLWCHRLRVESVSPDLADQSVSVKVQVEYLVVSGLQGGLAKKMACEETLRHLKLVPLGAVAACLSVQNGDAPIEYFPPLKGQLFCYLPVPSVSTQLPVHINALWELSSNRRDIWMGEDANGLARNRAGTVLLQR